jgi:hypothetical protein
MYNPFIEGQRGFLEVRGRGTHVSGYILPLQPTAQRWRASPGSQRRRT